MPQAVIVFAKNGRDFAAADVIKRDIKSSKNYSATSLGRFKDMFGKKIATQYIIHPKNLMVEDMMIKIPPYMFGYVF